jgi:hypothetical protein
MEQVLHFDKSPEDFIKDLLMERKFGIKIAIQVDCN